MIKPAVYWFKVCPRCDGQGRLVVSLNITANELYLHCDECEAGWRDPEDLTYPQAMFSTLDEAFEARDATLADIVQHGWQKYAQHKLQ